MLTSAKANLNAQCEHALNGKQGMSTSYHPRTDGQTGRTNRTLEAVLRSFISPGQSDWDDLLPLVEFAVNNSINVATGYNWLVLNEL